MKNKNNKDIKIQLFFKEKKIIQKIGKIKESRKCFKILFFLQYDNIKSIENTRIA